MATLSVYEQGIKKARSRAGLYSHHCETTQATLRRRLVFLAVFFFCKSFATVTHV